MGPIVYELHVEGLRLPLRVIQPVPEIIMLAWHRDADGVYELVTQVDGKIRPDVSEHYQDKFWELRTYRRVAGGPDEGWGRYEAIGGGVYLLCFAPGIPRGARRGHACHYIGWSDRIEDRVDAHLAGAGSPLVRAAVAAGLTVALARTWDGRERDFERQLKRRKEASRLCPLCVPAGRSGGRGLYSPAPAVGDDPAL